jgi:hypothetical protein
LRSPLRTVGCQDDVDQVQLCDDRVCVHYSRFAATIGHVESAHARVASCCCACALALALPGAAQVSPKRTPTSPRPVSPARTSSGTDASGLVKGMLEQSRPPRTIVYDLGAGDGGDSIAAAKVWRQGRRHRIRPQMANSRGATSNAGVEPCRHHYRRHLRRGLFQGDRSDVYLLPQLNVKLRPTILKMKPGTRVTSHQFDMETGAGPAADGRSGAYVWIVPATVAGSGCSGRGGFSGR